MANDLSSVTGVSSHLVKWGRPDTAFKKQLFFIRSNVHKYECVIKQFYKLNFSSTGGGNGNSYVNDGGRAKHSEQSASLSLILSGTNRGIGQRRNQCFNHKQTAYTKRLFLSFFFYM